MNRLLKVLWLNLITLLFVPFSAYAGNDGKRESSQVNWEPIMNAIIQVESGGNRLARNGNQCGAMQITPICVAECNKILQKRKSKLRYNLADRFNVQKSKEMFLLIQSYHNPGNDVEKAIRSWNGGAKYSVRGTQRYLRRL